MEKLNMLPKMSLRDRVILAVAKCMDEAEEIGAYGIAVHCRSYLEGPNKKISKRKCIAAIMYATREASRRGHEKYFMEDYISYIRRPHRSLYRSLLMLCEAKWEIHNHKRQCKTSSGNTVRSR